jgi:NAD-dependent SIR2 family protein deacetylase
MENDLNQLFDKKNLQKTFCEKCQKDTDHKNGVAWNHDLRLYYRVLQCNECDECLQKEITYESFKEEEKFLRLPA